MFGVDDCLLKINFLKGYTEYDGLEKSASCTIELSHSNSLHSMA